MRTRIELANALLEYLEIFYNQKTKENPMTRIRLLNRRSTTRRAKDQVATGLMMGPDRGITFCAEVDPSNRLGTE